MPLTDEQRKLVEDNLNLARYLTMKWLTRGIYNFDYDELMSIFGFALCKAGLSFDTSRGSKFSTFSVKCMQNELKMQFRKNTTQIESLEDEFVVNENNAGDEYDIRDYLTKSYPIETDMVIDRIFMEEAFQILNRKEVDVLNLRYFQFLRQEEISKILKISRSYVSRVEKRAIKKLREYYLSN